MRDNTCRRIPTELAIRRRERAVTYAGGTAVVNRASLTGKILTELAIRRRESASVVNSASPHFLITFGSILIRVSTRILTKLTIRRRESASVVNGTSVITPVASILLKLAIRRRECAGVVNSATLRQI